jgi:hypothetical protein
MSLTDKTHRRGFLGRIIGAAAAFGVTAAVEPAEAQAPAGNDD